MIWYTLAALAGALVGAAYGIARAHAAEARADAVEYLAAEREAAHLATARRLNDMLNSACDDIRYFRCEMEAAQRQLDTQQRRGLP